MLPRKVWGWYSDSLRWSSPGRIGTYGVFGLLLLVKIIGFRGQRVTLQPYCSWTTNVQV
jgi:hypothetical protein